jgi:argonaute-like protein implicated in RNA metabolism and viral defense
MSMLRAIFFVQMNLSNLYNKYNTMKKLLVILGLIICSQSISQSSVVVPNCKVNKAINGGVTTYYSEFFSDYGNVSKKNGRVVQFCYWIGIENKVKTVVLMSRYMQPQNYNEFNPTSFEFTFSNNQKLILVTQKNSAFENLEGFKGNQTGFVLKNNDIELLSKPVKSVTLKDLASNQVFTYTPTFNGTIALLLTCASNSVGLK